MGLWRFGQTRRERERELHGEQAGDEPDKQELGSFSGGEISGRGTVVSSNPW